LTIRTTLVLACLILTFTGFSQEKLFENGNLSIDYKNAQKVSSTMHLNSVTKIKSKDLMKVKVKCKIRSLNKERVDPNKFSLVDHTNKLRYRPTDISHQPVAMYMAYVRLLKDNINYRGRPGFMMSANPSPIKYDPEIKDSFDDYSIDGYTNIELPLKISKKKQSVVYFEPHKFKKFSALFFFAIPKNLETQSLEFYYGKNKVADVEL
tara:strand:- start:6658 stop:7281 length:624 start_codon:yes stop_codon:yes gene_type:complete